MKPVEKLTDEERELLSRGGGVKVLVGAKALRIIDQLTAALGAKGPVCPNCKGKKVFPTGWECSQCQGSGLEADRAEALQARVAELESALAAKAGYGVWMRTAKDLGAKLDAAEAELADLRGRVKRVEKVLGDYMLDDDYDAQGAIARALEALRGR